MGYFDANSRPSMNSVENMRTPVKMIYVATVGKFCRLLNTCTVEKFYIESKEFC
jgi:hypothetical protein